MGASVWSRGLPLTCVMFVGWRSGQQEQTVVELSGKIHVEGPCASRLSQEIRLEARAKENSRLCRPTLCRSNPWRHFGMLFGHSVATMTLCRADTMASPLGGAFAHDSLDRLSSAVKQKQTMWLVSQTFEWSVAQPRRKLKSIWIKHVKCVGYIYIEGLVNSSTIQSSWWY